MTKRWFAPGENSGRLYLIGPNDNGRPACWAWDDSVTEWVGWGEYKADSTTLSQLSLLLNGEGAIIEQDDMPTVAQVRICLAGFDWENYKQALEASKIEACPGCDGEIERNRCAFELGGDCPRHEINRAKNYVAQVKEALGL